MVLDQRTAGGGGNYSPPTLNLKSTVQSQVIHGVTSKIEMSDLTAEAKKQLGCPPTREELEREEQKNRRILYLTISVGALSMTTGVAAMYLVPITINYVAFLFPFVTAPMMVRQRHRLHTLQRLRIVTNAIRDQAHRLHLQNNALTENNHKLQLQVQKLQAVEQKLTQVLSTQGVGLEQFRRLVQENQLLLTKIKENQEGQAMQDIFTSVLRSDKNEDFILSEQEMELALLRLSAHENVNTDAIRKTWLTENNNKQWSVMSLVKNATHQVLADSGEERKTLS